MADYLKTMYHGQCHLVTASYAGEKHDDDNTFNSPSMDIMTSNIYDFEQPDFANFYINNVSGLLLDDSNPTSYSIQNTKPMIFSESDPIDAMCDNTKLEGQRAIWQSVFSGLAGSLSWDMQLHPQHFGIYGQIRNFIDGIDFDAEGWHPGSVDQSLIYDFDNSTTPPTFNGLLYNNWNHTNDYAKFMDGFVDPPGNPPTRLKKADLIYLRSENNDNCIGVLSNKTFNIRTEGLFCYSSIWNYLNPLDVTESSVVQSIEEDLILKKLNLVKKKDKYKVDYYYRNNLNTPVYSQIVNLNQPKLDMPLGINFNNYIVPFKASNIAQLNINNNETFSSIDDKLKNDSLSGILNNREITSSQIEIYPNPTDSYVHINFGNQIGNLVNIKSLEGKLLMSFTNDKGFADLNLNYFKSGIYIVEIIFENGQIFTEKIIKL